MGVNRIYHSTHMAARPGISRCRDDAGRFTTSIPPDLPHGQSSPLPQAALGPASPTSPTSMVALNRPVILNLKSVHLRARDLLSVESTVRHLSQRQRALLLSAHWSLLPP